MSDIVAFLNARLDEDEAGALATTPVPVAGQWKAARDKHAADNAPLFLVQGEDEHEPGREDYSGNSPVIAYSAEWQEETEADLRFIARHDPARVLREVEAKRRVMARHRMASGSRACDGCGWDREDGHHVEDIEECEELRDMASVYAEHSDYEQSWSVDG